METTTRPPAKTPDKVNEVLETAKGQVEEARHKARKGLARSEKFVREHATGSALTGMGLGILLAQLPLRTLAAGLIRAALLALRPLVVIYAAMKLWEEFRATESHESHKS